MRLVDRTGVEVLDRDECLRLLASREVGRLGIVHGGHPLILPLNYVVVGGTVVMRTVAGTKLDHARGSTACFQADDHDASTRSGWSVLAIGPLEKVTDYDDPEAQTIRGLPLSPWADGERPHSIRLVIHQLTGRRVGAGVVG